MPTAAYSPHPSPMILLTLTVILGASLWVFATLVRRETRHRRLVARGQWARSREMRLQSTNFELPAILKQFNPKIRQTLTGRGMILAQFETDDITTTAAATPVVTTSKHLWHIIVRDLIGTWPMTALRPTAQNFSFVDLFSLSSYPSLMPSERFVIFGAEARAAGALADSTAPALLPPDIALIVAGNCLILDFSSRHFDEIEFDRLINLAEQLAPRLSYNQ
jgi:hypothetical protein